MLFVVISALIFLVLSIGAQEPAWQAASRHPFEPKMIRIPAGSFLMDCQPGEAGCGVNEHPAHRVKLSAFELGKTEVTFAQWDACVDHGGCSHRPNDAGWGRGDQPVINVS